MAKGGSGKVQPSTTNTTATVGLNPEAAPYYKDVLSAGQAAFNAGINQKPSDILAAPNTNQTTAVQQLATLAPTLAQGAAPLNQVANTATGNAGALSGYGNKVLAGDFLSAESNPYLQGAMSAAERPIWEQLDRRTLPGLADKDMMEGAYGGARGELARGQAIGDAAAAAADARMQIALGNYQNERTAQNNVGQVFGQAAGLGQTAQNIYGGANELATTGVNTLGLAGDQEQQWAQQLLDAQNKTAMPFDIISQYLNLLKGGGQTTKQNVVTTPGAQPGSSAGDAYSNAASLGTSLTALQAPSIFRTSPQGYMY